MLNDFWRHLDEAIGSLLQAAEKDTTIIVLSDHGFGPQTERFYVNEWLRRQGYLKLKEVEGGKQPTPGALSRGVQRWALDILKRFPLLKPLRHFVPKRLRENPKREKPFESMVKQIDWQKTQAYSPPHTSVFGSIYVNLKGRENKGSVEDCFYNRVREEVIARFQSLRDQITDFQIEVFKREDLYHGRYLAQAPDLVYVINNFRCISLHSFHGDPVFQVKQLREDYSGTHRFEGIFIAKGPSIKRGHRLQRAEIIDIAPTLLHIFEVPIPEEMDGKVLKEIFQPESQLGRRDIQFAPAEVIQATVEPEPLINDSVRRRLEDLGYL
jgi:predicted AlkP superfamily phosphohydrolase/phosphomutase